MDIRQFMKRKSISDSGSAENSSDKRLRIEVQPAQTNGAERVKRFVNVHLHCIVSNLKRISKISALPPLEKFLRTPMDQERNEVRWRLGQEASLAPPCSKLRCFVLY